jgi:hypothetical protein
MHLGLIILSLFFIGCAGLPDPTGRVFRGDCVQQGRDWSFQGEQPQLKSDRIVEHEQCYLYQLEFRF